LRQCESLALNHKPHVVQLEPVFPATTP